MQYALLMLFVVIFYTFVFIAVIWAVSVVYLALCGDIVDYHAKIRKIRKGWQK